MTSTRRTLTLLLLAAAACGGSKSDDTDGSTSSQTTTGTGSTGTGDTAPTTGGTTGTEPMIYDQCKANDVDAAYLLQAKCMCLVQVGDFPDLDACLAKSGPTPEQADCACMVYGQHPETKAVLDCIGPPQKIFADCIMANGCNDPDAQLACSDVYYAAVFDCPTPTLEVEDQIDVQCLGRSPFMCSSGGEVPWYARCDFIQDCADGSDEVGCDNAFTCTNGRVIPIEWKCNGSPDCCNGEPDCMDMSDEQNCP